MASSDYEIIEIQLGARYSFANWSWRDEFGGRAVGDFVLIPEKMKDNRGSTLYPCVEILACIDYTRNSYGYDKPLFASTYESELIAKADEMLKKATLNSQIIAVCKRDNGGLFSIQDFKPNGLTIIKQQPVTNYKRLKNYGIF